MSFKLTMGMSPFGIGIGVIFDTRKGYFRYKISLYDALIVYHCVSSCINVDIMSLDDT